jgi:hypothetical protein
MKSSGLMLGLLAAIIWLFAFGQLPFRLDPSLPFKTMQSRVQRASLHREYFAGPAADDLRDGVTAHWFAQQRLQHEHVQRSLQQFNSILILCGILHLDVESLLP